MSTGIRPGNLLVGLQGTRPVSGLGQQRACQIYQRLRKGRIVSWEKRQESLLDRPIHIFSQGNEIIKVLRGATARQHMVV